MNRELLFKSADLCPYCSRWSLLLHLCTEWWNFLFDLLNLQLVRPASSHLRAHTASLTLTKHGEMMRCIAVYFSELHWLAQRGAEQLLVKTSGHIFNWLVQRENASFVTLRCLVFVAVAEVSPRLLPILFLHSVSLTPAFNWLCHHSHCSFPCLPWLLSLVVPLSFPPSHALRTCLFG